MNKKPIIISLISVLLFSVLFGYSLVFSGVYAFKGITLSFKSSNNIYLDSGNLYKTKLIFKSGKSLENKKITSRCNIFSKFIQKKDDLYLFELQYLDNTCRDNKISFRDEENEIIFMTSLNIHSELSIYQKLLDLNDEKLQAFHSILKNKINIFSQYKTYSKDLGISHYSFLKKKRTLKELIYTYSVVNNIVEKRTEKYIVPIVGEKISTNANKIPNALRSYRSDYTDGVHHGWDVGDTFGEKVVAIDDAIVMRVVSNFDYSDLQKIKKSETLTKEEKLRNLDLLRGNQVWLKTTRGDVIFYSHLSNIFTGIEEGVLVKKGEPVGTVGVSGVPEKNYADYHLHFAIHKNPYNIARAGKYDIEDYMKWDWYYKGKDKNYIIEDQSNLFEGN
ncbi:M23 family metallopeptidase [Candidatus Gracilibacteria bacterium 28_42_T64]|nr:M23 family metallopeptidase [Candidatus Gracilibacteria bacterium 28_42_T64]